MQLVPIIAALRARCPSLEGRVAGAAQFKLLQENQQMPVPCAFVVPLDDSPQDQMAMNAVRQSLRDSFAVIVALDNRSDEKGQGSADTMHAMRAELWAALLGWRPAPIGVDSSQSRYDGITYEGGQVLALDRARLWYQYEFGALMEIDDDDGWQETELENLAHFDGATLSINTLDPVDPNRVSNGLDDRIEVTVPVPKTGVLP